MKWVISGISVHQPSTTVHPDGTANWIMAKECAIDTSAEKRFQVQHMFKFFRHSLFVPLPGSPSHILFTGLISKEQSKCLKRKTFFLFDDISSFKRCPHYTGGCQKFSWGTQGGKSSWAVKACAVNNGFRGLYPQHQHCRVKGWDRGSLTSPLLKVRDLVEKGVSIPVFASVIKR